MSGRMQGRLPLLQAEGPASAQLVRNGCTNPVRRVTIMGRRREPLAQTAKGIKGHVVTGDSADESDCRRAVSETLDTYRRAGYPDLQRRHHDGRQRRRHDLVRLASHHQHEFERRHADRPGRHSGHVPSSGRRHCGRGLAGGPGGAGQPWPVTSPAKQRYWAWVRSMAVDFGPDIRVNALCPGWVLTPMSEDEMTAYAAAKDIAYEDAIAHATRFLPLRRMARPREIAACAEFLASEDASFITGTTLVADGGSSAVDVGYVSL